MLRWIKFPIANFKYVSIVLEQISAVLTSDGVMSILRCLNMIPDSLVFTSSGLAEGHGWHKGQQRDFWDRGHRATLSSLCHVVGTVWCVPASYKVRGSRGDSINPKVRCWKKNENVISSLFLDLSYPQGKGITTLYSTMYKGTQRTKAH